MTAMVLERETLPMSLSSFFAAPRIAAIPRDGGVFLTAASGASSVKQKRVSIANAYGLFKDLRGMDAAIEREECDRL